MFLAIGDDKEFKPSPSPSTQPLQQCRHFEFTEILIATEKFDESLVIGSGGFGKVYKGNIIIGANLVVAAIKRLDCMSNQGAAEFWAEVEMLSMLRHCNLVTLIGYCHHKNEMILVYEYMPNGTLDDHLHKFHTSLTWLQRLNICIGAGRGLHYLHTGTGIQSGVIHRDVKSSNILLHESWAAKVSDFGLSKIGPTNQPSTYVNTLVKGTFGYLDPNYYATGKLTRKSDVYAFGVVLLEVLCRKRAVDRSLDDDQWGLVAWVQDSISEGRIKHIIDSDIVGEISPKCLKEFVRIAERCLHNSPKQRPAMAEVVFSLESILASQEKLNNSLKSTGRVILDRMVNLFPFPSNGENSGDPKLSSHSEGNNTFLEMGGQSPSLKVFTSDDLEKATRKFSFDLVSVDGGFANVFLGWVEKNTLAPSKQGVGIPIAVALKRHNVKNSQGLLKRRNIKRSQGANEWLEEVNFLGQLTHPNIIRLLGYCLDEPDHFLVYEYMPNKSFDHYLFQGVQKQLSWGTRLLIMIKVARGLTYLHLEKHICFGLKGCNILLDKDFNAKLGDFEYLKFDPESGDEETNVTRRIIGTFGYMAPDYLFKRNLTPMCDIYGLGIVLLESITGQRAFDCNLPGGQRRLADWLNWIESNIRNVKEIMDPRLEHNYHPQGASECVALALRCVAKEPKDRPSSEQVLRSLEQIYALDK